MSFQFHMPDWWGEFRSVSLRDRIGRRGSILAIHGLLWIVYGMSPGVTSPVLPLDAYLYHIAIPWEFRSLLWVITGVVAIVFSMRKYDGIGFAALFIMPTVRASSYTIGWVVSAFGEAGYDRGWSSALIWYAILALLYIAAGWAEPLYSRKDILRLKERGGEDGS